MDKIAFGAENRPLQLGPILLSCYILENGQPILAVSGIQKALGYEGKSDHWLADLLSHIGKFIPNAALLETLQNAPLFSNGSSPFKAVDPETFLEICKTIVDANKDGFLNLNQVKQARQAEKVLQHLNTSNCRQLIESATGFKFYKEHAIAHFAKSLSAELNDPAFDWLRTFPESFFLKLFEFHPSGWEDMLANPKALGKIITDIVFSRLSDELLETIRTQKPKRAYQRKNGLQDNEHPELKDYVSTVLSLIKASGDNWNIFLQLLNRSFPKNPNYTNKFPLMADLRKKETPLSPFNQILKKMS